MSLKEYFAIYYETDGGEENTTIHLQDYNTLKEAEEGLREKVKHYPYDKNNLCIIKRWVLEEEH